MAPFWDGLNKFGFSFESQLEQINECVSIMIVCDSFTRKISLISSFLNLSAFFVIFVFTFLLSSKHTVNHNFKIDMDIINNLRLLLRFCFWCDSY